MACASQSLTLVAEQSSVGPAAEFARRGAREAGLTESRLPELDLIIEELVMNVARYAYPSGVPGVVEITYSIPGPERLSIEIAERGLEFNPVMMEEPDLTAPLAKRPVGGLGVLLVRNLTETIDYRRDGLWNRVRLAVSAASLSSSYQMPE